MDQETLVFIVVVDLLIVSLGFWGHYYDLWMRPYKPIKVEHYIMGYRPTYLVRGVVVRGSWTLDFLQVSMLVAALASVILWFTRSKVCRSNSGNNSLCDSYCLSP